MDIEELMHRKEELDPELKAYLRKTEFFECIQHPLVYNVPHFKEMNSLCNEQLKARKKVLERHLQEKDWESYVFTHERPYRIEMLALIVDLMSDQDFGKLFPLVLMDSENHWQLHKVIKKLLARKGDWKQYLMTDEEKKVFESLPSLVTLYRGCKIFNIKGFSWTINIEKAKWYSRRCTSAGGLVMKGVCNKSDLLAYWNRRGEDEIFVDPYYVDNIKNLK